MTNTDFRDKVTEAGTKGVEIVLNMLNGAPVNPERVRVGMVMVREANKVEHMNQLRDQVRISHAIRIANLLRDPAQREKYVATTHPELKPFLSSSRKALASGGLRKK